MLSAKYFSALRVGITTETKGFIHYLPKPNKTTLIVFKKIFNELKAEIENSLTNVNLIEKELPGVSFQALASKLRVKVTDNGVVKVDISLPSMAFSHIEDIINDDIKAEMEKNFIDISQLKRIYLSRGLPPSKVIDQTIGSKNYQVWLE